MLYFNLKTNYGVETVDCIDRADFPDFKSYRAEYTNMLSNYHDCKMFVYLSSRATKEWREDHKERLKEPKGTIISKNCAQNICYQWHGGQWSKLYSFGSSKTYVDEYFADYISEIDSCNPDNKKDKADLKRLRKFFEYKHWEANSQ